MSFSVQIKSSAARELARLSRGDRVRVVEAIERLAREPWAGGALKGEFGGLRRIRVGRYRIVYEVRRKALLVLVIRVTARKDAYR